MHVRGIPATKQLKRELAILNDPYFQSRRPQLLKVIERLQLARTRDDVRTLQVELIAEKGALDQIAPDLDQKHGGPARRRIQDLKSIEPKHEVIKTELRQANEILGKVEHMHVVVNALRHATRVVADGLVWRLLDFDRTALAILADREVVGRHAPEDGFTAEMKAMDRLEAELGTVVVHNDTPYCLRHGDITAIVEIDGRRFPYPEEVKAGRSRGVRQNRAITAAVEQIFEARLLVPVTFATHLSGLIPMIARATEQGYAEAKFDCRFVQVIDYRHFGGRDEVVGEILREADMRLGWFTGNRLILAGIAGASRIHDRGEPVAEIAPVTIFPLPAEYIVDLLMGAIDIRVHLNTDLLALEFRKRGITVEFARGAAAQKHFLRAERGYLALNVPAYVREQMLAELLTSEALVDLIEYVLNSGQTADWARTGETPVIAFADERSAWIGAGDPISLAA
jgi:hypothetical protein